MSFTSILESTEEFVWRLLKRWYYFVLAGLLEPFDFIGRFLTYILGKPIILPPRLFIIFLGVGFILAAIDTYHTLRAEKLKLDQRYRIATSKALEIIFNTGHPFEQENRINDSHGNPGTLRTFRVGVRNAGLATIERTHLDLESLPLKYAVLCRFI
jgi:hypothetical protein